MDEVKKHNHAEDGWLVVNGVVYNTTPYLRFHPGGVEILMKVLGRDATKLFNKYHPWVNVSALMDSCVVGLLERAKVEPVSKRDGVTVESPS
jgi:cytochrome b involved in lipid metabolism